MPTVAPPRSAAEPPPTVVGIDVGGSKTRMVLVRGPEIVLDLEGPGANMSSTGASAAVERVQHLLARVDVDVDAVVMGAAGAEAAPVADHWRDVLARRFPLADVRVVHDTALLLAAAGHQDGIALVAGTGSVAWGRCGAVEARAGGWGYLLGDGGSGYGVTRAAVQHVLDRHERGKRPDALTERLLDVCGVPSPAALCALWYADPTPRTWAGRAGLVFDLATGDHAAAGIVADAAEALVDITGRVVRATGSTGPVVAAGGLFVHQPLLVTAVRDGLRRFGPLELQLLDRAPVYGAVRQALRVATRARPSYVAGGRQVSSR